MDMQRTIHPDAWFTAADFTESGRTLTIDRVSIAEIAPGVEKSVVYFKDETKGLVLNQVNLRTIEHNTRISADHWENWKGKEITLYSTSILVKEEMMPCIRIKFLVNGIAAHN